MSSEKRHPSGPNVNTPRYKVQGTVRVIDKDGKVKGEFAVESIEFNEEIENAIEHKPEKHTG